MNTSGSTSWETAGTWDDGTADGVPSAAIEVRAADSRLTRGICTSELASALALERPAALVSSAGGEESETARGVSGLKGCGGLPEMPAAGEP